MTHFPPDILQRAGHQAAMIRRQSAIDRGATPGAMHERITFIPTHPYPIRDSPWWRIGNVVDEIEGHELAVWCDPVKRVIRVQTPEQAAAKFVHPPEPDRFPMIPGTVIASPRFRYFCEGVEYSPEEAGRMVAGNGAFQWEWKAK